MTRAFHTRFQIEVPLTEARERFVNRAVNRLFEGYLPRMNDSFALRMEIITALGDRDYGHKDLADYLENDFPRCLLALETLYNSVEPQLQHGIEHLITLLLEEAEIDLEVRWRDGAFYPAGASELDEALVNHNLDWLRRSRLQTVLEPFEKGLRHLLESQAKPELLKDVMTEMYEAFEAMVKVIAGESPRPRQTFLETLGVTSLQPLVKEYADYAHLFRHAEGPATPRPVVTEAEVEAFVYLTGLFLRLASRVLHSV